MAKKEIYFFTDPGLLDAPDSVSAYKQIETDSFGSVNGTGTKFLCCSVHTSNNPALNPPAYAITAGYVCVYKHDDGIHATLILKPTVQPGALKMNDLPSVKFYIYRGVLLSSVIDDVSIAPDGGDNDMTNYIWSKYQGTGAPPEESILAYQDITKLLQTPISASFENKLSGEAPYHEVDPGDRIGTFSASGFSMEIIFDDYDYEPELNMLLPEYPETSGDPLDYIRHYITAEPLVDVDRFLSFLQRNEREEVLHYLDPAAFYGSLYFTKVHFIEGTSEQKEKEEAFYNAVTSKFFNKNVLYLDLRNNHERSFNYYHFLDSPSGTYEAEYGYYPRYKDEVNIGMKEDSVNVYFSTGSYYSNGWPLRKITPPAVLSANTTNKNLYKIALAHDRFYDGSTGHDYKQMMYVANGFINSGTKFSKRVPKSHERFVDHLAKDNSITYPSNSIYFGPFEIPVPNIPSGSQAKPVCWYTRLYYLRQTQEKFTEAVKKNNIPDPQYFLDYVFDPVAMDKKAESLAYKNFRTTTYVDLKPEDVNQGDFTGSIGIAKDSEYTSLFILPEHSRFDISGDVSVGISASGGNINSGKSFLQHIDDHNFLRSISTGTLTLQASPLVTKEYHTFLRGYGLKNYSSLGLTLLIMQNSNWETVIEFIREKFDNQEMHEDFGVRFVIKHRNDANDDRMDDKDVKNPAISSDTKDPYLYFQLFVQGFRSLTAPSNPADTNAVKIVEFDLGLKFYGKKDDGSGKLSTIFLESNITNSLLPESPIELPLPELRFNENDDPRDHDLNSFNVSLNYSETEIDDAIAAITDLSSNITKEDLVDFISYIIPQIYEVSSYSTDYKITTSHRHNLFLLYHHVWSKMIETSSEQTIALHLMPNDIGNPKKIYNDQINPAYVLTTYNFRPAVLDSSLKVKLNFNPDTHEITGGSDVEHQGFFIEAAYTFVMWKLGKTMRHVYNYLNGLSATNIEFNIESYFNRLIASSPFYYRIQQVIEQNHVQPPHKVFENKKYPDEPIVKQFITLYSIIFKDNVDYGDGLSTIFNTNGYVTKIKKFNDFVIPDEDDFKRKLIAEIGQVKRDYLQKVIYQVYERLGGTGKYSSFHNFAITPTGNSTGHIFSNKDGIFFMDVYFDSGIGDNSVKTIPFKLQRSFEKGTVGIVHLGLYGDDQTTFIKVDLSGYTSKSGNKVGAPFYFSDENYRFSRGYENGDALPVNYTQTGNIWKHPITNKVLGSFNPDTGDFTITNDDVAVLHFKFYNNGETSDQEIYFNTICVSEIPASSMFSFAKAFPDLFTDDVFQLNSGQLSNIWNLGSTEELKNIDRLIDILCINDATLKVDMTGGFIGTPALPALHISGETYKVGDRVTFIAAGNDLDTPETETDYIDIYTATANTSSSPGSSSWEKQPRYSSSSTYQKGQFLSDGTFIYKCLEDNTTVGFNYSGNWKAVGQKYDPKKVFNYGDKIIIKDGDGDHHYYRCASNNISDDLNSIYWLVESVVESDERYAFNPDNNLAPFELAEVQQPPSAASLTADQFARVRYAYASMEWSLSDNAINVHIEAYASPLISRLDNVMSSHSKSVYLVSDHTLYGQDPTVDAFIDRSLIGSSEPDIPSYNQVLTALRCWGILEGIAAQVQARANARSTGIGIMVQLKLMEMLEDAKVNTTVSNGYPDISDMLMNHANYLLIKL